MANSAYSPGQAAVTSHEAAGTHAQLVIAGKGLPLGSSYATGRYYWSTFAELSEAAVDPTDGLLVCTPFVVGKTRTFDRIAAEHVALTTAGGTYRMGIYSDTNGLPDALVLDAGTIDLSTAAAMKEITINQQLTAGVYWLAGARQGSAGTSSLRVYDDTGWNISILGMSSLGGASQVLDVAVSQASVTGALPNPFTGTTYISATSTAIPVVALRAA